MWVSDLADDVDGCLLGEGIHETDIVHFADVVGDFLATSGELAVALPYIDQFDADPDTQALLRQVASDTLLRYPPCGE